VAAKNREHQEAVQRVRDLETKTIPNLKRQLAQALAELNRLYALQNRLEPTPPRPPVPTPPQPPQPPQPPRPPKPPKPTRNARVTGEVVSPEGYGRAEGYEDIERCTWKFKLRFRDHNGVGFANWRLVERVCLPADIQTKRRPPVRTLRFDNKSFVLELGHEYLTVHKPNRYSGSYRATFEFTDLHGHKARCAVAWRSPGRPPVGPSQKRPPAVTGVPIGSKGRFTDKKGVVWNVEKRTDGKLNVWRVNPKTGKKVSMSSWGSPRENQVAWTTSSIR